MLGFGGHWSTKSRRYSTTFTVLRRARVALRNVAAGVRPPKVQRAEMCFLDADQVEDFAEGIGPRWATLIRFGA